MAIVLKCENCGQAANINEDNGRANSKMVMLLEKHIFCNARCAAERLQNLIMDFVEGKNRNEKNDRSTI